MNAAYYDIAICLSKVKKTSYIQVIGGRFRFLYWQFY